MRDQAGGMETPHLWPPPKLFFYVWQIFSEIFFEKKHFFSIFWTLLFGKKNDRKIHNQGKIAVILSINTLKVKKKSFFGDFGPFLVIFGDFGPFWTIFGHFWPFLAILVNFFEKKPNIQNQREMAVILSINT